MLRLAAVSLLLVTLLAPPAGGQSIPEPLFLLPLGPVPDHGNLTTYPSNSSDPVDMPPPSQNPTRMEWWWGLEWLPQNATIPAGTEVTVVVHLARLGVTGPTVDPSDPTATGAYRFTAHLQHAREDPFGAGSMLLSVPPLADASTVHTVTITFETTRDAMLPARPDDVGDLPLLRLVVGLDGTTPQGATSPVILVAGADTPSRVHLPGFPWQAYRDAEDAAAAQAACNTRILQQEPCEDPAREATASPDAPLLGGGPGIGFLVAVAALSAGAVLLARRTVP